MLVRARAAAHHDHHPAERLGEGGLAGREEGALVGIEVGAASAKDVPPGAGQALVGGGASLRDGLDRE